MKTKAIIVDLDDTLCDGTHKGHLWRNGQMDEKALEEFAKLAAFDTPHEWCMELVSLYGNMGYTVLFVTARTATPLCQQITYDWLARNVGFGFDWRLIMRANGDMRSDYVVKNDLYNQHVSETYDVQLCIDDHPDVCEMWRSIGLTALQCK